MSRTSWIFALIAAASVLLALGLVAPSGSTTTSLGGKTAIVYMSSSCSCCSYYTDYLKRETDLNVKRVVRNNIANIKEEKDVPEHLRSCHTTVIGDYVVEGHVPVAAIQKLMQQQPSITGIALPGMPSGSPGMPGQKTGPFQIKSFGQDRESTTFMVL